MVFVLLVFAAYAGCALGSWATASKEKMFSWGKAFDVLHAGLTIAAGINTPAPAVKQYSPPSLSFFSPLAWWQTPVAPEPAVSKMVEKGWLDYLPLFGF